MISQVDPSGVGLGEWNEQALGPCHLPLWASHLGGPCDFEVAGSPFLLPSSGFPGMLRLRAQKGSFESLAPGSPVRASSSFGAAFHPSLVLTEARGQPTEIAPAAFPNSV